ncbi:MAG: hypothetical protein BGO43_04310 [Gammaproteobacteria bacterium 39-13]|nr:ankyrin repeat domain-containing protein [Gammaproteobacteria bacterium]OJV94907.1 MAG: hypothetical protein BGO43_04310 [Gammaproteobacteria bacterium 39-13]
MKPVIDPTPSFLLDDSIALSQNELELISGIDDSNAVIDFDDIFMVPSETEEPASSDALPSQEIKSIEEFMDTYTDPTDAGEEAQKQGFNAGKIIEHKKIPLHLAARDGNIQEILTLFQQGHDINKEDSRSTRPLHVAALFGKNDAAKLLISLGADVHDKGYNNQTALHFAIQNHHYDVAITLVVKGHADPTECTGNGQNAFGMLLDNLFSADTNNAKGTVELHQIIDTIKIFSEHCNNFCYTSDLAQMGTDVYITYAPISTLLKVAASYAESKVVQNSLLTIAENMALADGSHERFMLAKDLLHMFPTGGIYKFAINESDAIYLQSEGNYGVHTTELAKNSLCAFIDSLKGNASPLKMEIFESLKSIYELASEFTANKELPETAEKAAKLFHEGHTILLPSGWDGHFVDIFLSKFAYEGFPGICASANSGDRYQDDPAGIIFYGIHEPEQIDAAFMHDTLTNGNKMFLEYENAYRYGIFEKIDEILRDDQLYGNCSWESHRDAVEGIIYLELLKHHVKSSDAKQLAMEYYEEWDCFHGDYVIDRYMANDPGLPAQALIDIFKELHQKANFDQQDHHHAQKICDALISKTYSSEFSTWLQRQDADASDIELMKLFKSQYGVEIDGLVGKMALIDLNFDAALPVASESEANVNQSNTSPSTPVSYCPSACGQIVPGFNIAHQMMTAEPMMQELLLL